MKLPENVMKKVDPLRNLFLTENKFVKNRKTAMKSSKSKTDLINNYLTTKNFIVSVAQPQKVSHSIIKFSPNFRKMKNIEKVC